jgi:hypothetical protein
MGKLNRIESMFQSKNQMNNRASKIFKKVNEVISADEAAKYVSKKLFD